MFIEYLTNNLIYVIFTFAVVVVATLFSFNVHKSDKQEYRSPQKFFSKRDYEQFKKDSDKAISNRPISFDPNETDASQINNMYSNTMLSGTRILKDATFSIARVGDI